MLRILACATMLLLALPAYGQDFENGLEGYNRFDFEKGLEAYNRFDYATALRKWRPLAEAGDAVVQYYFGVMYGIGDGVAQDCVQSYMWLSLAAAQGHEEAAELREIVAEEMSPPYISEAERLVREWQEAH